MPVTLTPWKPLEPTEIKTEPYNPFAENAHNITKATWNEPRSPTDLLQTSFSQSDQLAPIFPSTNGLIYSVVQAYCDHHHLSIRPEDVWFAILTQFSSYVNANAEELRDKFVAHEGQKQLRINYSGFNRWTMDYGRFALDMGRLLEENIVDPTLRTWIMPDFTTTTSNDHITASVIMMGTLQKYFEFVCGLECGLPSVTLLGEKADYEAILRRLKKLESYGKEPTQFAAMLIAVLSGFIRSFDEPDGEGTIQFRRQIFSMEHGSGITTYDGWICTFSFWNEEGRCLYGKDFEFDGMTFPSLNSEWIAPGWIKVPIKIDDDGVEVNAEMIAGSLGIECSSTGKATTKGTVGLDSMQPLSGWSLYEVPKTSDK